MNTTESFDDSCMTETQAQKPGAQDAQLLAEILTADSCRELFADLGCPLEETDAPMERSDGLSFCAIVGFSGASLRGSLVLGISPPAITAVTAAIQNSPRDLMGELSNQLLGRLKNKLLPYGVELFLTIPVVLRGEHFAPMPRAELNPVRFCLGGGNVWLWIEVECFDGFEMRLEPSQSMVPMAEGDALLF